MNFDWMWAAKDEICIFTRFLCNGLYSIYIMVYTIYEHLFCISRWENEWGVVALGHKVSLSFQTVYYVLLKSDVFTSHYLKIGNYGLPIQLTHTHIL